MADNRLPLIHGRVVAQDRYVAIRGGGRAADVHRPTEVRSREALAELMGWHVPEERGPETEREVPDAPDPEGTL